MKVKVYIDDHKTGGRKLVDCELIQKRNTSMIVKLPDGNIILRRNKDLLKENKSEVIQ